MTRGQSRQRSNGNGAGMPQTPKYAKTTSDGRDIEFSRELADADDMEALARSQAADKRAKSK
ncbi:YfhD family protein [Bacillus sp. Marseille-P3661]|uniref:YfhD family protein n=1 Tax=Bacillus sp. Marseille-P3661 TaxID=1936234 RepID=UPI000C858794|nr:YfhD family protein [Bacillus sp. Marseille-P3661]